MITLLLCWINAKYKAGYDGMFVVTFILDLALIGLLKSIYG